MDLSILHRSNPDILIEDWRKTARNLALGGALGLGLGYALPLGNQQKPTVAKQVKPIRSRSSGFLSFDDLREFVAVYEGTRNKVYKDSLGIPTIGIGFNLRRSDARELITSLGYDFDDILAGKAILKDMDIQRLFSGDLKNALANAKGIVSNFNDLPSDAKMVVVDMVFNLGPSRFGKFRKTIRAFEDNDFGTAADEMMDSRWYNQVGNRSKRNVNIIRRLAKY